eukprot:TRINITY_DN7119_c0_g1_i6.p1 TRINITY_DN7119_c0_g1~~TRINITY_DN7119_c0_g1_i6.p1  ORF type:complete len:208 (+),score=22.02 TRINITY_DN7119_c0_g1_i6:65-688(+)
MCIRDRFMTVHIREAIFSGGHFFYREFCGEWSEIGQVFAAVENEFLKHAQSEEKSNIIGVYYDCPKGLLDKVAPRAAVGFVTQNEELRKEIQKRGGYQWTILPEVKAAQAFFPFKNMLSFMLLASKVYPPLRRYLQEKSKWREFVGWVEVYRYRRDQKVLRSIEVDFIYGEGIREYLLLDEVRARQGDRDKKTEQSNYKVFISTCSG